VLEEGRGRPALFLHGIPTFSYVWRDVLPVVARVRRCLAPDLLGFGYSEKPRGLSFGVAAQADLMDGLLASLGQERIALVAHDYGALVAAELIARDQSRFDRLVLTNTSLRRGSWRNGVPLSLLRVRLVGEVAMALAQRWMLKWAMRVYVERRERLTDAVMAHYWRPFRHGFKRTLLVLSRERWASQVDFDRWRAALAAFPGPVLIVWGGQDPTFTLDQAHDLAALMPQARLEILPGANHFVQEDEPGALGRLIAEFLADEVV
jgi:pimeloyl-ACP methyl ester carboxylesterase